MPSGKDTSEPLTNFVELFFSDHLRLQLDKIVFSSGSLSKSIISVPTSTSLQGESFFSFECSEGATALVCLLLQAAQLSMANSSEIPLVSGGAGSSISILAEEILSETEWIRKMFALDELQVCSATELFGVGRFRNILSVVLNSNVLAGGNISVLKNGALVTDVTELQYLQNQFCGESESSRTSEVSQLKLVKRHPTVLSDEVQHLSAGFGAPKILDIFSKKLEEQLIKNGAQAVKDKIDDLSKRELSYHLSQHTSIELYPYEWAISFEFAVINAGFLPISKRTHQYWFELPQGEIEFDIRDESGNPIKYKVTKSSEKYRELLLELPRVLQALERIRYKISYRVKALMKEDNFYYLSPRTLTKKLGLTVKRYDGRKFENARISVECEGGFMKDNPPDLDIEDEDGIQTLHWTQSSPRPGELYRTLWTNQESDWETENKFVALKDNVIRFPDRTS